MQNTYYNLLMSGNEEAWTGTSWAMECSRVFEHTHDDVKRPFAALDDVALGSLMSFPTIFAYEKYLRASARVGRITEVTRRQSEFAFTFAFDPTVSPIPYDTFMALLRELDIESKREVNRSHWAVKNVDLARVLYGAGLTSSPTLQPQARPPRVFISYSWDSPEHRAWVAQLASSLRHDGIDVILDQWHLGLGEELSAFMVNGVRESDRVLVICTEQYVRKGQERQGGVGYEQMLVSSQIMRHVGTNKFIPVVRQTTGVAPALPDDLSGRMYVDLSDGPNAHVAYRQLVHDLHNIRTPLPPLGPRPAAL
ncbi:hypothetical protein P3T23_009354 [Paraburkholderia sp. GAS448]|uniref:toll/interleukin-1 receptor domain-containing protein n=1 Tax=Paraburkholderia sp. GAS448 TaxID=3035136 RepID=UPI003D230463